MTRTTAQKRPARPVVLVDTGTPPAVPPGNGMSELWRRAQEALGDPDAPQSPEAHVSIATMAGSYGWTLVAEVEPGIEGHFYVSIAGSAVISSDQRCIGDQLAPSFICTQTDLEKLGIVFLELARGVRAMTGKSA